MPIDKVKTTWLVKGISIRTKEQFMGLAKMSGFRTAANALENVLGAWIKTESGKQLWKNMGREAKQPVVSHAAIVDKMLR